MFYRQCFILELNMFSLLCVSLEHEYLLIRAYNWITSSCFYLFRVIKLFWNRMKTFWNWKYFLYYIRIVVFIICQLSYFCKPRFFLFVRNCMWMYHYWLDPYFVKMNIVKNRMQKAYVKRRETYSYGLRMGQGVYCITFEPCACKFFAVYRVT